MLSIAKRSLYLYLPWVHWSPGEESHAILGDNL